MELGRATSVKSRTNGSSELVTVCSRNCATSSVISLRSYGSTPIRPASVQNACSSRIAIRSASNNLGHCSGAYLSHFALSARRAGGPAGDGYDL